MPPKTSGAKTSGAKTNGAKTNGAKTKDAKPTGTDNVSITQLQKQITQLREELAREQKERNYFQLERDKIHTFWEITKSQLEEKKFDLKLKDRELEKTIENHQTEIRDYKQKVKELLYEQQVTVAQVKNDGMAATKLLETEQADVEKDLRRGKRKLKMDLKEQQLANENLIKNLKLSHDKEISKLRSEFERRVQEIKATYETKMQTQQQEQDLRLKTEIYEIEQRNNTHVNMLTENHKKAFSDIKTYYNDLIRTSYNEISSLKEQVADMKKNQEKLEMEKAKVLQQNKGLKKSLQEAQDLKKKLTNYKKEQALKRK